VGSFAGSHLFITEDINMISNTNSSQMIKYKGSNNASKNVLKTANSNLYDKEESENKIEN